MVRTLRSSLPRAWVQSLVGELKSHKLCSVARKKKKKNIYIYIKVATDDDK